MSSQPHSGPSRPFPTRSLFYPDSTARSSTYPILPPTLREPEPDDRAVSGGAAPERHAEAGVGLGLGGSGSAEWQGHNAEVNGAGWKGKEREVIRPDSRAPHFQPQVQEAASTPSASSRLNRPLTTMQQRSVSPQPPASSSPGVPFFSPSQTPTGTPDYPSRRPSPYPQPLPQPPSSATTGSQRDPSSSRNSSDLEAEASTSSAGSSRSVSSSSARLSPRECGSPGFGSIELGLDALSAFGSNNARSTGSAASTPTIAGPSKLFGISSPSRLFSPRAIPYRRIAASPREPSFDADLCTSSSFRRSPLLKHTDSLLPTNTGSPRLRQQKSATGLGGDVEEEVMRAKSRIRLNKAEMRNETRKKRRRDRVCGLAGFSMLLVFGAVLLLIRELRKHASWHPATRPSASGLGSFFHRDRPGLVMPTNPERDTIVLYRIIGNDLPPRHSPRQTLTNLRFLLEHENDFASLPPLPALYDPDAADRLFNKNVDAQERWGPAGAEAGLPVEKFYVLNRLANVTQIESVRSLLHTFGIDDHHILEVSFEWDEYNQLGWRWDTAVGWGEGMEAVWGVGRGEGDHEEMRDKAMAIPREAEVVAAKEGTVVEGMVGEQARDEAWLKRKEAMARLRALDFTYHEKNLYAMNNNGGRNFALDHGRSLPYARWILPLDGNCFFTPSSMMALTQTLADSETLADGSPSHVVIPMARTLGNREALVNNTEFPDSPEEAWSFAPPAPDEPQIGFRWDSKERYSDQMRYGRRSKLELLWRLGAIDKARDLGKRSHPWETADKALLGTEVYGSIRTPVTDDAGNVIEHRQGFFSAGWVLRLFSGDQAQEGNSAAATTRRSINRIKGIVSFLEVLDEGVARGIDICDDEDRCGFDAWRLWTWDGVVIEQLRQSYVAGDRVSVARVEAFDREASALLTEVAHRLSEGELSDHSGEDATWAATSAAVLALAGVLTEKPEYRTYAEKLIQARFLQPVEDDNRYVFDTKELDVAQGDGVGYAFPIPRHGLTPAWLKRIQTPLPFDPASFDPTLLLDAVRLLSDDWRPSGVGVRSASSQPALDLPFPELDKLFTAQLSFLLLHPYAQGVCMHPRSASEGAAYDLRVAALAAFINDAQILGRIANRSRLRLSAGDEGSKMLHARLLAGLRHVKLRPFDDWSTFELWASPSQRQLAPRRIAAVEATPFQRLIGEAGAEQNA